MTAKTPTKRSAITLADKLKIINRIASGEKQSAISIELKLPKSTVNTIWVNREALRAQGTSHNPLFKKIRAGEFESVDSALLEWFNLQRSRNIPINGPILLHKAKEIADNQMISGFSASTGWLDNWKRRHGIIFKKAAGEGASVEETIPDEWIRSIWPSLKAGYIDADIFNADETGLFYRLLPDKTMEYKGKECHGGKQSKERLTLLLCTNATGTDKLKPIVIGKSQRPRCFKGIRDLSALPVSYYANKTAWMTSAIFTQWLREVNLKMRLTNRKILLILDNCAPHVAADLNLTNIKVVFLPPNVTSKLQPLDRGIINSFKVKYRRLILDKIIANINDGGKGVLSIDVLEAVYATSSSWNQVTSECIANCFKNAGITSSGQEMECSIIENDDDGDYDNGILQLEEFVFEDYVRVDDNVRLSKNYKFQFSYLFSQK